MTQKTPFDLLVFIREVGLAAELVFPEDETPTVALAARAMGCHEDQIVKSVLFLIRSDDFVDPVLVITNGRSQIDFRKLADFFGVGRKRIRLAPPGVVLTRTGYPAGGVPPFGFDLPIATFVDRRVCEQAVIFAGGGNDRTLLRTTPSELVRATKAQIIDAREEKS